MWRGNRLLRLRAAEEGANILLLLVEARGSNTTPLSLKTIQVCRHVCTKDCDSKRGKTWEGIEACTSTANSLSLEQLTSGHGGLKIDSLCIRLPVASTRSDSISNASLPFAHISHSWSQRCSSDMLTFVGPVMVYPFRTSRQQSSQKLVVEDTMRHYHQVLGRGRLAVRLPQSGFNEQGDPDCQRCGAPQTYASLARSRTL